MASSGRLEQPRESVPNRNGREDERSLDSLEFILEYFLKIQGTEQAPLIFSKLSKRLREAGIQMPSTISTPYVNTIPPEDEPPYPGNREIERRIKSLARWNAMAMSSTRTATMPASAVTSPRMPPAPHCTKSASTIFSTAATAIGPPTSYTFKATRHRATTRGRFSNAGSTNIICSIFGRNSPKAADFPRIRIRT